MKERWAIRDFTPAYDEEAQLTVAYQAGIPDEIKLYTIAHTVDFETWRKYAHQKFWEWQSPLFMPRWASRIELQILRVRAERLQTISQTDISREGIAMRRLEAGDPYETHIGDNRERFAQLWDKLNAKRGYAWQANPFVWVIEFELALAHD